MNRRSSLTALAAACALAAPVSPSAQEIADTPAQALAQVKTIGTLMPDVLACQGWGYVVDEAALDGLTRRALAAAAGGGSEAAAKTALGQAAETTMAQRSAAIAAMKAAPPQRAKPAVQQWTDQLAGYCAKMAAAPLMKGIVVSPNGDAIQAAKTSEADKFLRWLGQASWQTPKMYSVSAYLNQLGACEPHLGADKVRQLTAPYLAPEAKGANRLAEEQQFYIEAYESGLKNAARITATAADCKALTPPV